MLLLLVHSLHYKHFLPTLHSCALLLRALSALSCYMPSLPLLHCTSIHCNWEHCALPLFFVHSLHSALCTPSNLLHCICNTGYPVFIALQSTMPGPLCALLCVHSKGYVVNYSFFNCYVFISSFAAVMEIRDMNVIQQQ